MTTQVVVKGEYFIAHWLSLVRDICISVPTTNLLNDDFELPDGLMPPQVILPMRMPRKPMPTFFKLVASLP